MRILASLILGLLPLFPSVTVSASGPICSLSSTLLAHGYGAPDDVAVDGSRILFGDLKSNVLAAEQGGVVRTLISGLSVPEGIVLAPRHHAIVAEQGANRLVDINLQTRKRRVVLQLTNTTGREGVDGIARAPHGAIYVPDSPNGNMYKLDAGHHLHLQASGLGRPVGAIRYRSGVAVADENAHVVWYIHGGHTDRLATLNVPDDVAVFHGALLAVTLGDGGLWEVAPKLQLLQSGFPNPQGLATLDGDSVVISDSRRNGLYRLSGLKACLG